MDVPIAANILGTLGAKWSVYRSLLVVVPIAAVMGGIQAGLIIALRVAKSHDLHWPLILMASLSAALLAAGVLTHYWDIWTHRTVRGISFLFVAIDAAGDVFSLASVFFQPELDILGIVIYATEFVLWCGVFACGGYYNILPWARKRFGKEADCEAEGEERGEVIMMNENENVSSSSVFRTVSGSEGVRARNAVRGSRDVE
ncbi:PQ loop repeat-domain-containing protein [Fusarium acuminatum]|uniref:PQ loop repeat-domain-containing protein n=1 Tax=Fusarium acuminatum TaxID=5515 RepID=A0ABZ2WNT6_9HYPO